MQIDENQTKSKNITENQRKSMRISESKRKSVKIKENQRKSIKANNENQWQSAKINDLIFLLNDDEQRTSTKTKTRKHSKMS